MQLTDRQAAGSRNSREPSCSCWDLLFLGPPALFIFHRIALDYRMGRGEGAQFAC
jgi:hypothetical protein